MNSFLRIMKYGQRAGLFFMLLLAYAHSLAQPPEPYCKQAQALVDVLERYHFQPANLNDSLALRVYQMFLQQADPHSLFFLAEDTAVLGKVKLMVIGKFGIGTCQSFGQICSLFYQRLLGADKLIVNALRHPFDFLPFDTVSFGDTDLFCFAKDTGQYRKRWAKWLKYEALQYLFAPDSVIDKPLVYDSKHYLLKEPEIRNKIRIRETRNIKRVLEHPEGFESYVASLLYNAIAFCFDPHSAYFSPIEKRNFEYSLSADALSYGFEIEDKPNGTVQVIRLVPGGPAWKSNEINKGDALMQVKWPNGQVIDLSCSDQDEVEDIFQTSVFDRMELTIRKVNGQAKTVKLIKAKLEAEENLIKSFVLKGPKAIGYISLPGFYTEWENQDAAGCANDMAKEIMKLKSEKIDGLIIDLRNNGGGAMNEAVSLASIFVDDGPLCICRDKGEAPVTLNDVSYGNVYDGPLILMINGFSASASEIFTAALQDYHRAIVVGSQTFGKASGQIIVPIGNSPEADLKEKDVPGFVKITVSKFYRLSGASYQQKGVNPDISLPAYNEGFFFQEASLPYSLVSDSVKGTPFHALPPLPLKKLREQSYHRVSGDERFRKITMVNDSLLFFLKQLRSIPLNLDLYKMRETKVSSLLETMENLADRRSSDYFVANTKFDQPLIQINSYKREFNELSKKNIQKDIYIEESYRVICDFINYKGSGK